MSQWKSIWVYMSSCSWHNIDIVAAAVVVVWVVVVARLTYRPVGCEGELLEAAVLSRSEDQAVLHAWVLIKQAAKSPRPQLW